MQERSSKDFRTRESKHFYSRCSPRVWAKAFVKYFQGQIANLANMSTLYHVLWCHLLSRICVEPLRVLLHTLLSHYTDREINCSMANGHFQKDIVVSCCMCMNTSVNSHTFHADGMEVLERDSLTAYPTSGLILNYPMPCIHQGFDRNGVLDRSGSLVLMTLIPSLGAYPRPSAPPPILGPITSGHHSSQHCAFF